MPTLLLIHEYLSTTPEAHGMPLKLWNHVFPVFPAQGVLDHAIRALPPLGCGPHAVCVPGACEPPVEPMEPASRIREDARIRDLVRPPHARDAVVVLGMGAVCPRKGTDLFLMVARDLRRNHPDMHWRFVWVGKGYDPWNDPLFSRTLQDQIRHLGLEDSVVFAGEIDHVALAHRGADVFFLSSRADPFPLVAMDALRQGLPVVCFDETTGLAAHLRTDPRTAPLVVPFLDLAAAGEQIALLARQPGQRRMLGALCREYATRHFAPDRYRAEVAALARGQVEAREQRTRDRPLLREANVLDPDFLAFEGLPASEPDAWADTYLRQWAGTVGLRKPFPGFHPGIYRERVRVGTRDPLCHWLEAGHPAGPWLTPVIRPHRAGAPATPPPAATPPRTALHFHVFYPEMIPEFLAGLQVNRTRPDLWVTVTEHLDPAAVREALRPYPGTLHLLRVPNRGRDLGPLITALGRRLVAEYDIVGHVHTKKTEWHPERDLIARWRRFLIENVLGGRHPMMDVILDALERDPGLGLVFPNTCMVADWDAVQDDARDLARRMGIPEPQAQHFEFPVGSFFWARTHALRRWLELDLDWTDYPAEPVPIGRTRLHALERLSPFVVEAAGYRWALTHVPGFTW